MLVLFFIVFFGILVAVYVYLYENSQFSKVTGHAFTSVWTNKEVRFLYKIAQNLKKVNGEFKLLFKIALPESGREIDYILLHPSGVYVINAKHPSGWIYGKEQDIQWAQVFENGHMNTFQNPIIENALKIDDLKRHIPEVNEALLQSLIVFNNNCSFKKIEVNSADVEVMKIDELKSFWKDKMEDALTKEQIMSIYSKLEPFTIKNQPKPKAPLKDASAK